jgi:hypothetical protein
MVTWLIMLRELQMVSIYTELAANWILGMHILRNCKFLMIIQLFVGL